MSPLPRLVLASTSAYRRAQLTRLGVAFEAAAPDVDEAPVMRSEQAPSMIASQLAEAKARSVAAREHGAFVLGADQLVEHAGEVLGKPGSEEAAQAQLARLSGTTHRLITAVCLLEPQGRAHPHLEVHWMHMRPLSQSSIERYVARDKPVDCAGSYKIERAGIALFERIDGRDFTAIEGLPLMAVSELLRSAGFRVP